MLTGIRLQAHPTGTQKCILSQWMGCSRFIWNAKCDEDKYLRKFAQKFLPIGTYPELNQSYARYKDEELSPWLSDCPSQVLRNTASNWYSTYKKFLKGSCGRPKKKRKGQGAESIHLTRELFSFEKCPDGVIRLFIGNKKNNIGYLSIKNHADYDEPKSIRVLKEHGEYFVSFSYDDGVSEADLLTQQDHFNEAVHWSREKLESSTVGIDRGVAIPVQAGEESFDFSPEQKIKKKKKERYIRRCQRRLAQQKKGSKRRNKRKRIISKAHKKIANIRKDFAHKTSRKIVDNEKTKVIILEDLRTKNMTKRAKPKKDEGSKGYQRNNRKAKSGLNSAILDKSWHQIENYIYYKSYRAGKAVFKVPAHHTSQECSDCSYTHPDNRKNQSSFCCENCGHTDNADKNAAEVIKKRAINLILHSGTELSKRGVLLDIGRGATHKSQGAIANCARSNEASKKKGTAIAA